VHFEPVGAVLERVVLAEVFGRQLASFPDRHEPGIQRERKRCADDEAARFDRRYLVDAPIAKGVRQRVDRRMEAIGPLQQCRDVAKQDARPRKVGDRADQRRDV